MKNLKRFGFTLAEVLITLGVIGVVSAMTLPVLINKINDMQYDRARQRVLATVGEAGRIIAVNNNITSAATAEDFVKNYLSEQLKIAKYCGNSPTECGFPDKIKQMGTKTEIDTPTTIGELNSNLVYFDYNISQSINNKNFNYSFLLNNGYSINLFYNPYCKTNYSDNASSFSSAGSVCINAIYDMNGKHGPNEFGKDIGFVTIINNNEKSIAVAPAFEDKDATNSYVFVNNLTNYCKDKNLSLPTKYELLALSYNSKFTNLSNNAYYMSGLSCDIGKNWIVSKNGVLGCNTGAQSTRCVRR